MANYADHTIFVARQNVTTRQKTRHTIGLMDQSEAPVLGVVFNGVTNTAVASGYGGSYGAYGSEYGYQYGYSKDADKYKKYYETK